MKTRHRRGWRRGVSVPVNEDANPMASVTQDATSLKYTPANSTEWATTAAAAGISAPSNLWLLQEASGNFADSIASQTMTATSVAAYQASVSGWTRKFITTTPQGGARGALITTGTFPNLSTTSHLTLLYWCRTATITGDRDVGKLGFNAADMVLLSMNSSHQMKITPAPGTGTPATGSTAYAQDTVFPVVLQHNKTGSVQRVATHSETFSPTFQAIGPTPGVGIANVNNCVAGAFCYYVSWQGAAAEMSSAQIKTLLQTLGWTVAW